MRAQRGIATLIRARRFELLDLTGFVVGAWVANEPDVVYPQSDYRLAFYSPDWTGGESAQLGFRGGADTSALLVEVLSDQSIARGYWSVGDENARVDLAADGPSGPDPLARLQLDTDNDTGARLGQFQLEAVESNGTGVRLLGLASGGLERLYVTAPDLIDVNGKMRLVDTGDVSVTSTGHAFQIGPDSGLHLCIDSNEIMARDAGPAVSNLGLQLEGGIILAGHSSGELRSAPVYSNTSAATSQLVRVASSAGQLQRSTSRRVDKRDVEPIERRRWRELLDLPVYWYRSNLPADRPDWSWYGIMAEDAAAVDPRLAGYDQEAAPAECPDVLPPPDSTNYLGMVAPLVALCQEQETRIERLEQALAALTDRLDRLGS